MGDRVGRGVSVGVAVGVDVRRRVREAIGVLGVGVEDAVVVAVPLGVGEGVRVAVADADGVALTVSVAEGVTLAVAAADAVALAVTVGAAPNDAGNPVETPIADKIELTDIVIGRVARARYGPAFNVDQFGARPSPETIWPCDSRSRPCVAFDHSAAPPVTMLAVFAGWSNK